MHSKPKQPTFSSEQLQTVNQAVTMAEELVSNHFKMSPNEWLRPKYDVKTLIELTEEEIIEGPFAQIIRYQGQRKGTSLGSESYDFYKICLQDHTILTTLEQKTELDFMPFCLYIIAHELIHIVRFSKFLQSFDANQDEKLAEEKRVHSITRRILADVMVPGIDVVLGFYDKWR